MPYKRDFIKIKKADEPGSGNTSHHTSDRRKDN